MTNREFVPLVICYPPGAGGNFLASALDRVLFNKKFQIDDKGSCHGNHVTQIPHYVPHDNITGMQNELLALQSMIWPNSGEFVAAGHARNLVALQSLRYDLWFIKITFDYQNPNHIKFLAGMLLQKVTMHQGWQHCYQDVRERHWPNSLEEFLAQPNCRDLYMQQTEWSLKSWYWIENQQTMSRTLELDLHDIFLGIPGDKLSQWFNDDDLLRDFFDLSVSYQSANRRLYPDLIKLLE